MRHLKKIGLLVGVFVIILALTTAAILYVVFDADRYKSAIEERLEAATGMKVTVNGLSLGIMRGVAIEGEDITFQDPSQPYPQFTIEKLSLGVKTRPLLSKQVIIKRMNVKRPVFNLPASPPNEKIEIKPLASRLLGVTSQAAKNGFFLEVRSVSIIDGQVVFHDRDGQATGNTEIRDLKVSLSGLKPLSPTRYAVSGELRFNDLNMPFSFRGVTNDIPTRFDPALVAVEGTGRISNVPGRLVKDFVMPQGPVQALEGVFDIRTHYRGNLGGTFDAEGDVSFTSLYVDYPKLFKGPLSADHGTIKYALTFKDDSLMVRRFEIASKETAFKGSFTIEQITSEHGVLTGQLSTSAMAAEDVVQFLPSTTSAEIKGLVKSMKPSGEMEVKNLKASGPFQVLQTDESLGPILTASADLVLRNLGLTFAPEIPPFKNWKGEISYNGKGVIFHGVGGSVGDESLIESIDGDIQDITGENPLANLTIVTRLRAGDFRKTIKHWLSREKTPFLSEETAVEGEVKTNLVVIGPIKQPEKLNISGSITLNKLSIKDPTLALSLDNISGLIKAYGDTLKIERLSLLSKGRPIQIEGSIGNYMGDAVTFNDVAVDLGGGLPQLKGIHGRFDKKIFALEVETSQPIAFGDGWIERVYTRVADLNTNPSLQLTLLGKPTASQVYQLAKLALADQGPHPVIEAFRGAQGKVEVNLNASGPIQGQQGLSWAAEMYLDGVTFPDHRNLSALRGVSGKVNLTPEALEILTLTASAGESEVAVSGSVRDYLAPKPDYAITVETAGLDLKEAARFLPSDYALPNARGTISGRVTATGPLLNDLSSSRLEGDLSIDDGALEFTHAPSLEALSADMLFRDGLIEITEGKFTFQDSPASFSGTIRGLSEPLVSLDVHLDSLDIDKLSQNGREQSPWVRSFDRTLVMIERTSNHPLIRDATLNVNFEIDEGTYKSRTFGPIKSASTLEDQKLTFKETEIATSIGTIKGDEVYMDFSGMEPTIFGLKGELADGDVSKLVSSMGPEWNVVTGTINISTSLKCREEGIVRGLSGCLEGHLLARLEDGYVRKIGFVEPLAEKLKFADSFRYNRPDTVPTLPYKIISGDFAIQDGILTTNNFSINGAKIKIDTDGQVNLFHDTMDLKVSVLTFNALNQIVHRIPVVNLFAEDDKSLIATYYEVSGVVGEPQVVSIQNRSLEMVLIRTFHKIFQVPTRIIKAPIELMNQIPPPELSEPEPQPSLQ